MKKALIALVTAASFAAAAAIPSPADAQGRAERRFFQALGIGAAVVGGALLFGAAARAHIDPRYHTYAPVEGYYYYPQYVAAPLAPCPGGFWAYRMNSFGQPVGQPRWVCPPQGYAATQYIYR
ncbi:MAG: hypothetical protein WD871_04615 [Xanthobacteraceae bacterium]